MQCNIDRKGRIARAICGLITLGAGVAVLVLAGMGTWSAWWPWAVGAAAVLGGGFQLFEARRGWCVMRAMGFRTPM